MHPLDEQRLQLTRRHFFSRTSKGIGIAALANLLGRDLQAENKGLAGLPHFAPKAKRVIYLFQSGGPAQMDLFDYKPALQKYHNEDLPDSIRGNQRLTGMTAAQSRFPVARSHFEFKQYGPSGAWISELLPHTAKIADKISFIRTLHTEAINHDPAITYIQTGSQIPGRPSLGAWLSYGLGSLNENLPHYVVMHAKTSFPEQSLFNRLWGTGFLPSEHQGMLMRSQGDPVLYLSNPEGFDPERFSEEAKKDRPRYAYFPFGGGARVCLGQHFATMEAQLLIAMVMQRCKLDLVPGQTVEAQPMITLRPKDKLMMVATPTAAHRDLAA